MADVKESAPYQNMLGHVEEELLPPTLPIEEGDAKTEAELEKEWKKHWVGMPEFVQEHNLPYKKIFVSFRTKEDYEEFARLIDQNLSEKTKSIWYPKLDRDANSLKRWIENDAN